MTALRLLIAKHRAFAALAIGLAMLAKVLIPGGYMPMVDHGAIRIMICSGTQSGPMMMAMPGMAHHGGKPDHPAKDIPCGFSGLSFATMSAADPVLLVLAVAFAMMLAARRIAPILVVRAPSLRPPPRGPPIPV